MHLKAITSPWVSENFKSSLPSIEDIENELKEK